MQQICLFTAGWHKLMQSVEKYVPAYSLRLVCTFYEYFFRKIAVSSYIFCFEFMSSYVLIDVYTQIHNYIHTVILIQNCDSKRGNGSCT